MKFRFAIGAICIVLFVASVVWAVLRDDKNNTEYPMLKASELVYDRVESVEVERSFGRLRFRSGLKKSIYFSRNNAYVPSNIVVFLQKGDLLSKRAGNDTVRVIRGMDSYTFVLGKEIYCCQK